MIDTRCGYATRRQNIFVSPCSRLLVVARGISRLSLTYLGPTRPYGRGGPRREGAVPQGPVNMCVPIEEQLDVLTPVFSLYSRDKPHWLSRYIGEILGARQF